MASKTTPQTSGEAVILETLTSKTKKKKTFGNVSVERTDNEKIVLPEGMSYSEARTWLEKIEKSEETITSFDYSMKAYPIDGAYALFRAMQIKFGYADMIAEENASGDTPPKMISVRLPDGSFINVPWGRLQFPGLDSKSYLETKYDSTKLLFIVGGQIKKKFSKAVDELMALTEKLLQEESIYKGHAIRVDLSFMTEKNPDAQNFSQPEFMDEAVMSIQDDDVIIDDVTRMNYASVFLRIEKTKECTERGITLKHGMLLAGPYGTGKTLLAKYTAKKGITNGWTFIYLEDARQLSQALRLASMYAPAVVFSEDIDKAVEGSRTVDMNTILNTLDGVDTKTHPIITILTTNHLENINKAFLRAGRIDSLIQMKPLDNKTGLAFLHRFAKDQNGNTLLVDGEDYSQSAEQLVGIVPAFASEVLNKAKTFALYNGRNTLLPGDIATAAISFKEHIKLTTENKEVTKEERVYDAVQTILSI